MNGPPIANAPLPDNGVPPPANRARRRAWVAGLGALAYLLTVAANVETEEAATDRARAVAAPDPEVLASGAPEGEAMASDTVTPLKVAAPERPAAGPSGTAPSPTSEGRSIEDRLFEQRARLRSNPGDGRAWGRIGDLLAARGDAAAAAAAYSVARLIDPAGAAAGDEASDVAAAVDFIRLVGVEDDRWIGALAASALGRGQTAAAEDLYALALEIAPGSPEWRRQLAALRAPRPDPAAAEALRGEARALATAVERQIARAEAIRGVTSPDAYVRAGDLLEVASQMIEARRGDLGSLPEFRATEAAVAAALDSTIEMCSLEADFVRGRGQPRVCPPARN